jgi:hypothetical protein
MGRVFSRMDASRVIPFSILHSKQKGEHLAEADIDLHDT